MKRLTVRKLYDILFDHYGPRNWWPAETRFEVMVGAILTQNTAWSNVEKAITNLKEHGLMEIDALAKVPIRKLEEEAHPTGFFRQKAERVKNLSLFLMKNYNSDLDKFFDKTMEDLRKELLELNGIGPETADSILLYAGRKPIFVIDAYTKRLCSRLDLTDAGTYDELQAFFMDSLPEDVQLYNEYHALIVEFCKNICTKKPKCDVCFLNKYCQYQ